MAITDIVKCEDEKEFLIWKYPEEIFKTTTKLIVGAGKEAVFYKKGNSYDVLPEGEYVLNSLTLPLLDKVSPLPVESGEVFSVEIWFDDKNYKIESMWENKRPITLTDTETGEHTSYEFKGEYVLKITNSSKFVKYATTFDEYEKESIEKHIKTKFMDRLKDVLVFYVKKNEVDLKELTTHKVEISKAIKSSLESMIFEYGIKIMDFKLNTFSMINVDICRYEELPKMKNVCKNCGTILPEGAAFCFTCGEKTNNW